MHNAQDSISRLCAVCNHPAQEAHHAIVGQKKKAGKKYRDWTHEKYNLMPLCKQHHPPGQPWYLAEKQIDEWMQRDQKGFMDWLDRCPDTGINKRMERVMRYLQVMEAN
jgi:hypothetical protein